MKASLPIRLYTLSLLLALGVRQGSSNLVCVYDSLKTVACTWTPLRNVTEAQCQLNSSVEKCDIPTYERMCDSDGWEHLIPDLGKLVPPDVLYYNLHHPWLLTIVTGDDGSCRPASGGTTLPRLHKKYYKTCQLSGVDTRSCELIFDDKGYSLTVSDTIFLAVSCHTGENGTDVQMQTQTIDPFQIIQLKPPCDIQLDNASLPSYNLTWKLCALSHYLPELLEYEVWYKRSDPDEAAIILSIHQDQNWLKFENLSPDTVYEAAVRVKTQSTSNYRSVWSNWSAIVTWKAYPKVISKAAFQSIPLPVVIALVGSPVYILLITIVLRANPQTSKWFRKVLKIHLPDPAKFFPSLTAVHGDVQKWLSSPLSMSSFHIATASPDVSVLEVIQKGKQESCLLLSKEHFTVMDASETSGHSTSSGFINRGYFFFHHLDSLENESYKVYFTYDCFAQENSGSEDGDSCCYKVLHATDGDLPLSSYGIMGNEENGSFLPETTQKVGCGPEVLSSTEIFPIPSAVDQDENKEGRETIVLPSESPHQSAVGLSSISEQCSSNTSGTEPIRNVASHTSSVESNRSSSSVFLNQGQTSELCRTVSSSQVPISEAYLSLRDLQSHYNHHSV